MRQLKRKDKTSLDKYPELLQSPSQANMYSSIMNFNNSSTSPFQINKIKGLDYVVRTDYNTALGSTTGEIKIANSGNIMQLKSVDKHKI